MLIIGFALYFHKLLQENQLIIESIYTNYRRTFVLNSPVKSDCLFMSGLVSEICAKSACVEKNGQNLCKLPMTCEGKQYWKNTVIAFRTKKTGKRMLPGHMYAAGSDKIGAINTIFFAITLLILKTR